MPRVEGGEELRVGLRPHLKVPRYPFSPLRAIATKDVSMRIEGDETMAYIVLYNSARGELSSAWDPTPGDRKGEGDYD